MENNNHTISINDELGTSYIIGLWILLLASIIAIMFGIFSLVTGKGSIIDIVVIFCFSGLSIGVISDIKNRFRKSNSTEEE